MTAILFVLMAFAVGGTVGVCWSFFGPGAAEVEPPPAYPEGVSMDLADLPLRRAWDSLTDQGRADMRRLPPDRLREELHLIAWMEDLATPTLIPAGTDYGMSFG